MKVKITELKGMRGKLVEIDGCTFPCSSNQPYYIIMCLLGREDELICAIGRASVLFHIKPLDEEHIAKLMFVEGIDIVDIQYACDVCRAKGIVEISYFFGILNNLITYNTKTNNVKK